MERSDTDIRVARDDEGDSVGFMRRVKEYFVFLE
jgi:hypothetical protein